MTRKKLLAEKMLCLFMTVMVVLTVLPVSASAADGDIVSFDPITIDAGVAGSVYYANAASVITYLNDNYTSVTANTYNGGTVPVPVTGWRDTDSYDPATAGSYTFTATLGDMPQGYANTSGLTATAEVIVAGGVTIASKYNIKVTALNEADDGTSPVAALLAEDAVFKVDGDEVTATLRFSRGAIDGADTYGSNVTGITTEVNDGTIAGTKLSSSTNDYTSTYKVTVNDIGSLTKATATIKILGVSTNKTFRLKFDSPTAFYQGPVDIPDGALRQTICALLGEDAVQYAIQAEDMAWLKGFLNLGNKGIKDLTGLRHAVNVTYLSLTNSSLGSAENLNGIIGEIVQLPNLEQLNLSNNGLTTLPDIGGMEKLKKLNLSNNALTALPAMGGMTGLAEISVQNNQLTDLPQFGDLPALTTFYGGNNRFEEMPESLFSLTSLVTLDLQNNVITEIGGGISALPHLETLTMNNNLVETLPDGFNSLSKLKAMAFMNNKLTALPSDLSGLTSVTSVVLSNNNLETIPEGLFTLPNLESLSAESNSIREVGGGIGNLGKLKTINLMGNQIEALPDSMNNLTSLTKLEVQNNKLTILPDDLSRLTSLTTANFENNKLVSLPDSIGDWEALATLDLDSNALMTLPATMSDLENLTTMNLSHNNFETIPGVIASMFGLKAINMNNNKLAALPSNLDLSQMTAVTAINLNYNRLTEVPAGLRTAPNVKNVYLNYNFIVTIPENYFDGMSALKTLGLNGNFIQFGEGSTALSEVQKLRARGVTVTGDTQQGKFATLKSLETSIGNMDVKNDGVADYVFYAEAPRGTSSIILTPTGAHNDTTISLGDETVNSGESLTVAGLAPGVNTVGLTAYNPVDGSQVVYEISVTVDSGSGSGELDPENLADGTYSIDVDAMHATSEQPSMTNQFVTELSKLTVVDGNINLTMVWHGTPAIPMSVVEELKYQDAGGSLVDAVMVLDTNKDTLTITVPVESITEPLVMQVYAPQGMAESRPYLRVVFNLDTLTRLETVDPENLADGQYTIDADALKEISGDFSMTDQFLTEPARLSVVDGRIIMTMVWHGTQSVPMTMVEGLWYKNTGGDFVEITRNIDAEKNTLTFSMPLSGIIEHTIMKVYAPDGMGETYPLFRLAFNEDTLVRAGESVPDPDNEPVKEIPSSGGAVTIGRDDIEDIIDPLQNIGLDFGDVSINFPVQYLNSHLAGDASGTGSLQLRKNETSTDTQQNILSIMADNDTLVGAIDLDLRLVSGGTSQPITNLGGRIKITFSLTDEQVAKLDAADTMKICYYNPSTGALEDMGAVFDLTAKTATLYTDHFSSYVIISTTSGPGTEPGNEISNGSYTIRVSALQEYSDDYSMADQFIKERAGLQIEGDTINVTMVWYGTTSSPQTSDGIHMSSVKKLQYKESSGSWVNVTTTLNTSNDTLLIEMTVSSISEPVYMRVQADEMGPEYKVFRLVFYESTLEEGRLDLSSVIATTTYTITATASEGGSISPAGDVSVDKGGSQTFTVTAGDGYQIKDVLVDDKSITSEESYEIKEAPGDGESVGVVGQYTFKDVEADHTIQATFEIAEAVPVVALEEEETVQALTVFKDTVNHWAEKIISFVVGKGIFSGTGDGLFSPDAPMTRGMFVTVLGRLYGVDTGKYTQVSFGDVPADSYYAPYVEWARVNGIVNGVGNNSFAPDNAVTREEAAVIFANYRKLAAVSMNSRETAAESGLKDGPNNLDASALKDGSYTVEASALQEKSDSVSMTNQLIKERVILNVVNGITTATLTLYGTEFITMDMVKELKYQKTDGSFVEVNRVLDMANNKLTLTFPVAEMDKATIMQVYVPAGMGESRPKFRLVLDTGTLAEMDTGTLTETVAIKFADEDQISAWAKESVEAMQKDGLIRGDEENRFNPQRTITRAEAAAIFARSLGFNG